SHEPSEISETSRSLAPRRRYFMGDSFVDRRRSEARNGAALLGGAVGEVEGDLVDVAPAPVLGRVVALDDRVLRLGEVLGRVSVGRAVAAADVAAAAAEPQVHPGRAGAQALLAAERAGDDVADAAQVIAGVRHQMLLASTGESGVSPARARK